MTTLAPIPVQHFVDSNGNPLSGGKLFTYAAGTTTKIATYTDSTGATQNTNPVVLNTRGEANVWLAPATAYKFVLAPANDSDPPTSPIWTVDQIINEEVTSVTSVANIAALRAATTFSLPVTQCYVLGYYAGADGGEGTFWYNSADVTSADNGGTLIVDSSGRRWYRTTQNQQAWSVKWFGAYGDDVHDDTSVINSVLAIAHRVHFPEGTYLVSNALNMSLVGQVVFGDGIGNTTISVPSTFNLSAPGVFSINMPTGLSGAGPSISDLSITFAQTDTATKSSLIQFPPAIYATNTLRGFVRRVQVNAGWNGVYLYANTNLGGQQDSVGGWHLEDLNLGCLNYNIYVDGGTDPTWISRCEFWPFGCTANQQQVYLNSAPANGATGIYLGRADDFHIIGCMFFITLALNVQRTANLPLAGDQAYGEITNCNFNAFNGIQMNNGLISGAGNWFGLTGTNCIPILMNGGNLSLSGTEILNDAATNAETLINVSPTVQNAYLTMTGVDVQDDQQASALFGVQPAAGYAAVINLSGFNIQQAQDHPAVYVPAGIAGNAEINLGCGMISRPANTSYASPVIFIAATSNAVLNMHGVSITPKGTGSGTFISIAADNWHRVIGNSSNGWSNSFPTPTNGVYQYN